jgi:hypothetical protein
MYLTAFIRDGDVAFRNDIYDRDDALLRALAVRDSTAAAPRATDQILSHDATREARRER